MPNFEHIQADNGDIIQINSAELATEQGRNWLKQELDSRRSKTQNDIDSLLDDNEDK